MTYEIKFSKQATKFINGLQQNLKDRIIAKFREISENPFRFLEHYEGDYYKIRIGDFRALVDIDNERRILWIRVFDKRGRIYER
jgi:mRNA interferase RelE/StbE